MKHVPYNYVMQVLRDAVMKCHIAVPHVDNPHASEPEDARLPDWNAPLHEFLIMFHYGEPHYTETDTAFFGLLDIDAVKKGLKVEGAQTDNKLLAVHMAFASYLGLNATPYAVFNDKDGKAANYTYEGSSNLDYGSILRKVHNWQQNLHRVESDSPAYIQFSQLVDKIYNGLEAQNPTPEQEGGDDVGGGVGGRR